MDITINGSKSSTNGHSITDPSYKQINEKLEQITRHLLQEIDARQKTIEEQRQEIADFKAALIAKTTEITELQEKLAQCAEHREGHRQLINKLLNDIEHFQNDIDWYKRTYERRSFWGVLKEKLTRRK